MFIVRLENIKIRQDLSNDEVAKLPIQNLIFHKKV